MKRRAGLDVPWHQSPGIRLSPDAGHTTSTRPGARQSADQAGLGRDPEFRGPFLHKLTIVDGVGYMPFDHDVANLLFNSSPPATSRARSWSPLTFRAAAGAGSSTTQS